MGFTPNIPTADESLNDSRPEISGNFQALREAFSVNFTGDHVDPNDMDAGKHWWVRMLDVGADIPPTADNQLSFYVKQVLGASQIFYKDRLGNQVQFSSNLTTGASGRSLPLIGGLVMKVGSFNKANGTFTESWAAQVGSNFSVQPIYYNVARDNTATKVVTPGAVTTTQFTFKVEGGAGIINYIAIGIPL